MSRPAYDFLPESDTSESLYDIVAISNNNPKPDTIKSVIKDIVLWKDGACYREMERYLRAPGVTGSKAFDQGNSVNVLLKWDHLKANSDENDRTLRVGRLRAIMNGTKANEREVWDRLVSVLRDIGFRFKHGRLVGAISIEDQADDDGAPDID